MLGGNILTFLRFVYVSALTQNPKVETFLQLKIHAGSGDGDWGAQGQRCAEFSVVCELHPLFGPKGCFAMPTKQQCDVLLNFPSNI